MPGQKISQYGADQSPVTTDYVLGNKASGPSTATFKLSDLITLFFNNITAAAVFLTSQFSNPYKFSVYRNAALTSTNAYAVIAMDTKVYDTGSNIDVVTNKGRFTAPIAGFYWFAACCGNTAATNTAMGTALWKNGSLIKNGMQADPSQVSGGGNLMTVSCMLQLAAGDYVEPVFVGGGGSIILVGSTACYFDGELRSKT